VAALVLDGARVLLVRRAVEPRRGSWDVPGGFLELGEHPVVGIKRELREETGLEIEPVALHGFFLDDYPEPGESTMNIYFLARIVGGTPHPASDVDAVAWFHRDALPDDLAFRNNREALDAWRRGETRVLVPGWPLGTEAGPDREERSS
jgi:ADP-ribose pyrophosphatase YjhB (NUDIX family)